LNRSRDPANKMAEWEIPALSWPPARRVTQT